MTHAHSTLLYLNNSSASHMLPWHCTRVLYHLELRQVKKIRRDRLRITLQHSLHTLFQPRRERCECTAPYSLPLPFVMCSSKSQVLPTENTCTNLECFMYVEGPIRTVFLPIHIYKTFTEERSRLPMQNNCWG